MEVAVPPWDDQALHADRGGEAHHPRRPFAVVLSLGAFIGTPPVSCRAGHPITYKYDITFVGDRESDNAAALAHGQPGPLIASTALQFQPTGTVAVRLKEGNVRTTLQRATARNDPLSGRPPPHRSPCTKPCARVGCPRSRYARLFQPRYGHDSFAGACSRRPAGQRNGSGNGRGRVHGRVADRVRRGPLSDGTAAGRRLLAHELAHVAQQRNASVPGTHLELGKPSDAAERAADAAAQHALGHATTRTVDAIDTSATVRRTTAESWAGTFDNDLQYDLINENDGKGQGKYGSPIQIRFSRSPSCTRTRLHWSRLPCRHGMIRPGSSAKRQTARRRRPARRRQALISISQAARAPPLSLA